MHQNKCVIILFGLCSALVACESAPTGDLTEPEAVASRAAGAGSPSTSLLAASNSWATKRSLWPWRGGMKAGTINGVIYVVGGERQSQDPPFYVTTIARVDAYSVATNTWSHLASMPAARVDPNGASAINGKLYVSGGWATDHARMTRTLFVYDPATNSWTRKADMPLAGYGGIQGVIGGQLYVYMSPSDPSKPNVLFRYNPATNSWVSRAAPPMSHRGGVGEVINGKFYLAGSSSLSVYNPASNSWATKATPLSGNRYGDAAAVLNGKLYLMAGSDAFSEGEGVPRVDAYDPLTNTWTIKAPLPIGGARGTAARAGGRVFYISGNVYQGVVQEQPWAPGPSEVYAYTP